MIWPLLLLIDNSNSNGRTMLYVWNWTNKKTLEFDIILVNTNNSVVSLSTCRTLTKLVNSAVLAGDSGRIRERSHHHLHYHQLVSKNLESTLCACTEVSSPVVGLGKLVKGGCTFYPQRPLRSYNIISSR